MIGSKLGQRCVGLFVFLAGGGFTARSWYVALTRCVYHSDAACLFPVFAVGGLGLLLCPIDREQLRAEHGVDRPERFAHLPFEWKIFFFACMAAGLGNWFLLSEAVSQRYSVARFATPQGVDSSLREPTGMDTTPDRVAPSDGGGPLHELWSWFKIGLVPLLPADSRLPALLDMVRIDLRRRWARGLQVTVESYLMLYPEFGDRNDIPGEKAGVRILNRSENAPETRRLTDWRHRREIRRRNAVRGSSETFPPRKAKRMPRGKDCGTVTLRKIASGSPGDCLWNAVHSPTAVSKAVAVWQAAQGPDATPF